MRFVVFSRWVGACWYSFSICQVKHPLSSETNLLFQSRRSISRAANCGFLWNSFTICFWNIQCSWETYRSPSVRIGTCIIGATQSIWIEVIGDIFEKLPRVDHCRTSNFFSNCTDELNSRQYFPGPTSQMSFCYYSGMLCHWMCRRVYFSTSGCKITRVYDRPDCKWNPSPVLW